MNELFRALPALLKQFDDNDLVREAVVFAAWRKVAGPSLLRHAVATGLSGERLYVATADQTWQRHLEQLAGQMIFRLNSVLGQAVVRYIEFGINAAAVEDERAAGAERELFDSEQALAEVNEKMRTSAEEIKDDELRRRFLLAAGSCLARKRRLRS